MSKKFTLNQFYMSVATVTMLLTCLQLSGVADEPLPAAKDHDKWMAVKLTSAQQIFAHLTNGDMQALQSSARRMQVMNILEQWSVDTNFADKSEYQGQLNAFDFATKELIRHAGDDNVDGALKAYVSMTQSCVRCHQLIRDDVKPD